MSKLRRLSFLVIACTIAFHAAAQDAKKLAADALAEYNAKHFAKSADLFRAAIATGGASPSDYYNGSCAMALAGLKDEAFATLREAARRGYANADQLLRDTDLVSLRGDARWAPLLDIVKANSAAMAKKWDNPLLATPYRENLPDEEKLAGLSRVWSEVRYNFANFDLVPDVDWDALYLAAIPRVISTKSTLDYYNVLIALVAKLRDGHTEAWQPSELAGRTAAMPAIRQDMVDGHVVVIKPGDAVKELVRVGDEIVTVDSKPWKDYAAENVTPYINASTQQDLDHRIADRLLTGAEGTTVTIGIRHADGTTSAIHLDRQPLKQRIRLVTTSFELRMLPNGIAYVALNEFDTPAAADEFDKHFDEISNARALILDVRSNGGGSTGFGYRVLSTLTDKTVPTTRGWKMVYRPTDRARRQPQQLEFEESQIGPDAAGRLFRKPAAVLIGPGTFSAAEDFAVAWKVMKRGLTIGTASGGSTGQPLVLALPGGGGMRICTKRDRFANGDEFVGIGIKPDVEVHQTLEDFRAGRDAVLERAIAELSR